MPLFVVEYAKGPDYDRTRDRRSQEGWQQHAAFMDGLFEAGLILAGGPVGDIDQGENTLHIVRAEDETEVRRAFEPDPWYGTILKLTRVEQWTTWLGALPA